MTTPVASPASPPRHGISSPTRWLNRESRSHRGRDLGHAHLYFLLASRRHRAERPGLVSVLRRRHRRASGGQVRALVHPGSHAVLLRGTRGVRGKLFHGTPHVDVNWTSVVFAVAVTMYFWWQNTKGIQESSEKALRVMQITTVMVIILLVWSAFTLLKQGFQAVPLPSGDS